MNHLAAFLLTDLLLDRLKASAPARIVTVSSNAQSLGKIDFEDLQGEHHYSGQDAYNQSKLANVMFTFELARRLAGTGVTANVLHPGVVNSGFGAEDPSRIFKFLVPLWRPFMKTPQQGAATSIYLASSPEVEGVTGTYFANGRPRTANKASHDVAAAARLWQVSASSASTACRPQSALWNARGRATRTPWAGAEPGRRSAIRRLFPTPSPPSRHPCRSRSPKCRCRRRGRDPSADRAGLNLRARSDRAAAPPVGCRGLVAHRGLRRLVTQPRPCPRQFPSRGARHGPLPRTSRPWRRRSRSPTGRARSGPASQPDHSSHARGSGGNARQCEQFDGVFNSPQFDSSEALAGDVVRQVER